MRKNNLVLIFGIVLFSMSGVLAFDTYINNTNIFVDGALGIGTDTPSWLLEVLGGVNLNNSFYVNSSSGNVGIGTSSPYELIHVKKSGSPRIYIESTTGLTTDYPGIVFEADNTDSDRQEGAAILVNKGSFGRANMHFLTSSSNDWDADTLNVTTDTRMTINYDGNVGIGVSDPAVKLEVNGYTMLGSDAPAIKYKMLNGTLTATASETISHGVSTSKILGLTCLVETQSGYRFPPGSDNYGGTYFYRVYTDSASTILITTKGTDILSKPYECLIVYRE